MTDQAIKNRAAIEDIKRRLKIGAISYEQAQAEAEPVIELINKVGAEIAKKHKKRYTPVGFSYLMR